MSKAYAWNDAIRDLTASIEKLDSTTDKNRVKEKEQLTVDTLIAELTKIREKHGGDTKICSEECGYIGRAYEVSEDYYNGVCIFIK